jgi:hypothetical protein
MSTLINEKFDGWDKDGDGKKWEDYDTIKCPDGQVIDMNKLFRDQEIAKAALLHIMPWFGEVIAILKPIYTFRVKTQATDGAHLLMNPQFTYNLTPTEKVFVLAHEIMHCMLNHMRRGKDHDQERSNIAADYEVNLWIDGVDLIKASTIQGLGGLFDEKYRGWGYERIYADNPPGPKQPMNNKQQAQQAQQNQQGQGQQGKGNSGQGQSGAGGGKKKYTADYKAGWNQAMEDYKNGKIKL